MKKTLIGVILAFSVTGSAVAQTVIVDRTGGYGLGSAYNRLFDTTKMVTFSGKIRGIQVMPPMRGMADGAILLVKASNGGTALVDVGPAWFIDNQPIRFNMRDTINVTGSKIIVDGRGTIIASRISKGSNVLVLRNEGGVPLWAAYQVFPNGVNVDPIPGTNALNGTIEEVATFNSNGVVDSNLVLRTNDGLLNIDLGPTWFVERQGMAFQPGNFVTIYSGVNSFQANGSTFFPAFGVVSGNGVLRLRDGTGFPIWQGWNAPKVVIRR
jgi:hypothetical protein